MRSRLSHAGTGVAASALLAACAVTPAPPVIDYVGSGCVPAPDLTAAVSLTPERETVVHRVSALIDASTPCVSGADGPTPYVVFALPADHQDKVFDIGASIEQVRIFAVSASVLDAEGRVTRTFPREDYFPRSGVYSVQFQARPGDTYVLVSADPDLAGRDHRSVAIGTSSSSTYAGGAVLTWTMGVDDELTRTFSYAGPVLVTVRDAGANAR